MEGGKGLLGAMGGVALPANMLAGFLDAVPAHVAIVDPAGIVLAVNAGWRTFGVENGGTPDGCIGANYHKVAEASNDPDALAIAVGLRAVLAGALNSFDHEYPCHGSGQRRWYRCVITPLPQENGEGVVGAAVMHLDVTSRRLAEERALAASRAKSEFLANLSHELRTPLNAVIGFSEMLMMGVWGPLGDERYAGYAGDIHSAGRHLLSLINEVLDLSKVEAGRFELHEEPVNVAEVLPQCLHLVEDRAKRAGVDLLMEAAPALPKLTADPRLLRQILLNLLSNAVKFTPSGGRVITRAELDPTGAMRLSVADSGIGIAPEHMARVLEPFGQVHSQHARQYETESTGLGLPLTRRFTELHGGRLILDSALGKGTTVTVLFPPGRVRS